MFAIPAACRDVMNRRAQAGIARQQRSGGGFDFQRVRILNFYYHGPYCRFSVLESTLSLDANASAGAINTSLR
jgi:hypothetical protein